MENNKYLSRAKTQALIDGLKVKKTEGKQFLDSLAAKGYTIEGYNDQPKKEANPVKEVAQGLGKAVLGGAINLGSTAQAYGGAAVGYALDRATPNKSYAEHLASFTAAAKQQNNLWSKPLTGQEPQVRDLSTATGLKQATGDALSTAANFIGIGEAAAGAKGILQAGKAGAAIGGTSALGNSMQDANKGIGENLTDAALGAGTGFALGAGATAATKGVGAAAKLSKKGVAAVKKIDTVDSILPVSADDATKTVLNPFKEKVSKISIPTKNGYIVKDSAKATPSEVALYQTEADHKYKTYLEQSKKFVNDRSVDGGGGLDLAAANAEKNVKLVDLKRKEVGSAMGEIEKANSSANIDLNTGSSFNKFVDNLKNNSNKGSYAGKESVTPETEMFLNDAAKLQQRGTSVKEVLDFTRSWQNKLEDMKDKFGDFKDNKFSNTNIQNVINEMKNSVRDQLSQASPEYKKLVGEYRLTSEFKKEANRLMGQNGLYNEPIKGTALMKRAVESNSDAGARQFLKTLRDITGYDGISDATIAIKAMKDAGDSQGLSLLGIMNEATNGGITGFVKGVYKGATNTVFNQEKRTQRLINKDYSPILKTVAKNPNTNTPKTIPTAISSTNISKILADKESIVKPYINTARSEVPSSIRKYLPKNWDTLTKVAKNQAISAISNEIIKQYGGK